MKAKTQDEINAELRRPLYADVESLLVPGFLTCTADIGGVVVSMRSSTPGDLFMLRNRTRPDSDAAEWKQWAVATTIWMVDGQSILEDPQATIKIRNSLRRLPNTVLDILFSIYLGLFNRVGEAINKVESFCYEAYSRKLWRFCGKRPPNQMGITGVPGTERLGLNHIQQMWLAYNLGEDERLAQLQSWNEAKLIASANAPKGVKKLNQKDQAAAQSELARRGHVQDQMYYASTGRADMGNMVIRSVTAAELEEEMRKVVAGEKDYHDLVVEQWKGRVRQRFDDQKKQAAARREALEALEELEGETRLVGYTPEQLDEVLKSRKHKTAATAPGARFIPEAGGRAHHLADRGYLAEAQVGQIVLGQDGVNIRPMDTGKKEGRDLNAEIANRRVTMSTEQPKMEGGS